MIDLDLSPRDAHLLALAREQGRIARGYARHYDRAHGEPVPDALPEAADAPDVRALAADHVAETSGAATIDALLFLEETWGTIPFRKASNTSGFLGSKLVRALGTPEQAERWSGKLIAIALTEPEAGSDPSRIRATAVRDAQTGEWVLTGEKIFISLARSADALLVFARFVAGEEKGMGIFVVDKGTAGLTVGAQLDKLGQRAWDTANLVFDGCRLPAGNRLEGSMKETLAIFNGSRPLVSAIGLGFARAALDLTRDVLVGAGHAIDYARASSRLSAPAAKFLELEAAYEAAWLTFVHTKWVEDTAGADKIEASVTKVGAAKAARRITDGCLAILGPEAASERHLIEMWLRDARVCDIYEGPGEVNRLIIARDLLGYSPAELA
jgi:acyl-CoA dehydrogenase